jgi:hypothetical protein
VWQEQTPSKATLEVIHCLPKITTLVAQLGPMQETHPQYLTIPPSAPNYQPPLLSSNHPQLLAVESQSLQHLHPQVHHQEAIQFSSHRRQVHSSSDLISQGQLILSLLNCYSLMLEVEEELSIQPAQSSSILLEHKIRVRVTQAHRVHLNLQLAHKARFSSSQ